MHAISRQVLERLAAQEKPVWMFYVGGVGDYAYPILSLQTTINDVIYTLIWTAYGWSVPEIRLWRALGCVSGPAELSGEIKPADVKEIVWKLIDSGLEADMAERFQQARDCLAVKPDCEFCSALLKHQGLVRFWFKDVFLKQYQALRQNAVSHQADI